MSYPTSRNHRGGFTLVELLVVIVIILSLLWILLPMNFGHDRGSHPRSAARRAQLTSISNACEAYYINMGNYPGPFSPTDLDANMNDLTGTENLVVGLLGWIDWSAKYTGTDTMSVAGREIEPDNIGRGPGTEGSKYFGAFYSPKKNELGKVQGTVTGGLGDPNTVPEFLDVATGMPLLYYRAVAGKSTPVGTALSDTGKIFRNENQDYTESTLGLQKYSGGRVYEQHKLSLISAQAGASGSALEANQNLSWIMTNQAISVVPSPVDATAANNTNDVVRGAYILINAGEDGIYFNKNSLKDEADKARIDEYSDLNRFDDVIVGGGSVP